jgi:hypothetical protein
MIINTLKAYVYLAAIAGFLIMLGSALWFERSARKLGRAGLQQVTASMRAGGLRDYFGNTRTKMRERFKREE